MKALQVFGNSVQLSDVAVPTPDNEALVRVVMSGVCNTDLEIVRGYAGFSGTIGHEFVGIVEEAPDSPGLVGNRVVGEINVGCGSCQLCLTGDPRHCPTRTVLGIHGRDGAHAEFLKLPAVNLIPVPDDVPDESAVFAEPLAAAYGIFEQVDVGDDTRVAIVGDGKLGLLCAMTMKLKSDNVVMIGKHPEKMKIVGDLGVETLRVGEDRLPQRAFDVVVEASGSESGFATALSLVRPRGKIVLKSTFHGAAKWEASGVVVDEISIIGSRCGRLAPAVDLLASKSVKVGAMISEEFPLEDGIKALERAARSGVLKVVLRP